MPNDIQSPDPGHRNSDETPHPQVGHPRAEEPTEAEIGLPDVEDTDDVYRTGTPAPSTAREPFEPGPATRARRELSDLAVRLRSDASQVADPQLHALLESSADVLQGLARGFADHPDPTGSENAPG